MTEKNSVGITGCVAVSRWATSLSHPCWMEINVNLYATDNSENPPC